MDTEKVGRRLQTARRSRGLTQAALAEIEEALDALLELTGQRASDAIIHRVFENFCVGK